MAKLMREAAACWRLRSNEHAVWRISKLPPQDRSDLTELSLNKRLHRRLKGIETLASELQPTSLVGVAYQLLLATNQLALDDHIEDACGPERTGGKDMLSDRVDTIQNTLISSYHALRRVVHDADLDVVERPHDLEGWKPSRTVTALIKRELATPPQAKPQVRPTKRRGLKAV